MKEIKLTKGYTTQVSDEDYEELSSWKWHYDPRSSGYARRIAQKRIDGKQKFWPILMHRLIMNVTDSKIYIDHIDGDGLNNQRENLRIATNSQNQANRKKHKSKTYKYKGVRFVTHKTYNYSYWLVRCDKNHKAYYGPVCKTEIEAAIEYNKLAIKLHG